VFTCVEKLGPTKKNEKSLPPFTKHPSLPTSSCQPVPHSPFSDDDDDDDDERAPLPPIREPLLNDLVSRPERELSGRLAILGEHVLQVSSQLALPSEASCADAARALADFLLSTNGGVSNALYGVGGQVAWYAKWKRDQQVDSSRGNRAKNAVVTTDVCHVLIVHTHLTAWGRVCDVIKWNPTNLFYQVGFFCHKLNFKDLSRVFRASLPSASDSRILDIEFLFDAMLVNHSTADIFSRFMNRKGSNSCLLFSIPDNLERKLIDELSKPSSEFRISTLTTKLFHSFAPSLTLDSW